MNDQTGSIPEVSRDDIRTAVAAGHLSEAQAATLISHAHARRGARENLAPGDEPFELFKGFNEIFIIVGLLILATGWTTLWSVMTLGEITNPQIAARNFGVVSIPLLWLLSEYFIRRRRMIGPANMLTIMFAGTAAFSLTASLSNPFMIGRSDFSSIPFPMILATGALLIYWVRFRVPFAMALIALSVFAVAMLMAATAQQTPQDFEDFFLLSAGGPFAWITLALGVVVFVIAMIFDMSDPYRVTRRSANGFWLHVIAAPALVNTIALTLLDANAELILLIVLLAFATVAIIVDRRSFLIAAIGYVVILAGIIFDGEGTATTIVLLGVILLLLGAFWEKIRARVLKLFGPVLPLKRLPPSA